MGVKNYDSIRARTSRTFKWQYRLKTLIVSLKSRPSITLFNIRNKEVNTPFNRSIGNFPCHSMLASFHPIEAPPSFYSSLYSDQEQNLIHGTFFESVTRDWCKTRTGKSIESIPCENSEKRRGKWIERSMWRVAFDHDESRWSQSDQLHPCSPPRIAGVSSWTCHNVHNRKAHFSYFCAFYPSATLPHLPYGPFFHQEYIQPFVAQCHYPFLDFLIRSVSFASYEW